MLPDAITVLMSGEPSDIISTCQDLCSAELDTIDLVAKDALRGRPRASRSYARAYESLLNRMIESFGARTSRLAASIALTEAPNLLVSNWVQRFGPGAGVAVALVERIRRAVEPPYLQEVHGLTPTLASRDGFVFSLEEVDAVRFERFRRYVVRELRTARRQTPLHIIAEVFDLNDTELARLFGITRQAVQKWLRTGNVPGDRRAKVVTTLQIAEVLLRNLKPDRIPGIVRKPAGWFAGKSIVEMISDDRHDAVLDRIRASFDWSATA
ncbi:MAG: hypothetical protein J7M25_04975 [Deltaproteobacteria bacterium]|nr:hypothetical protein [Deltaproteobacteria bacterium]